MKYSNIGGQAVMEGVMMRNGGKYAVAVRTVDGGIAVVKKTHTPLIKNEKIQRLPIIRGIISFVDSLVLGMSSLMLSAEFFAEESVEETKERLKEEKRKTEKKAEKLRASGKEKEAKELLEAFEERARQEITKAEEGGVASDDAKKNIEEKEKDSGNSILMGVTVFISVLMSVGLFMLLPYLLASVLRRIGAGETVVALSEALLRMTIFFLYMFLISRMKDIQRTFMYHGAEHKCINCIENGMELNVENVRKSSRQHKRCGTSFLLYVMVVSVIFQLFFVFVKITNPAMRIGIRLLMIPLIAGIAFEFIRLAGQSSNACVNLMSKPGLALQKLTTKEPDDSQIEVGIASVEAIFDWKKYLNENFGTTYPLDEEKPEDD